jgi:hypothetical protein
MRYFKLASKEGENRIMKKYLLLVACAFFWMAHSATAIEIAWMQVQHREYAGDRSLICFGLPFWVKNAHHHPNIEVRGRRKQAVYFFFSCSIN